MVNRTQQTKQRKLVCCRPAHVVLTAIFCVAEIATTGSHALAQHLTLEDVVSSVDSAADTPDIDAAVVTSGSLCTLAQAVLHTSDRVLEPIVSLDALHEMTVVRIATEWGGVLQGYGWQLANTRQGRQWRHAGSEAGFESLLTIYPDAGFAIAVLGNRQDWPRFEFEQEIMSRLLKKPNMCADN